jgi:hypothetical protein
MSSNSILKRTEEFFDRLEAALGRPSPQNRDVVAEVRADFHAQVDALQEGGMAEDEAVEQVLAEFGEPEALAAGMKRVLPPLSSGPLAVIRYVLAGGAILWTLALMWTFRAWDYGLSPGLFFALLFHLPVILVLWPKLIWRKNWLFGVVPAAVLVGAAIVLNVAGTSQTSMEIVVAEDGSLAPSPDVELAEVDDGVRWQLMVLIGALGVAVVILFGMMQQRRQRLVVLVAVLVPLLIVEGAFQWEESVFRAHVERVKRLMADPERKLPARGTFREMGITASDRDGGGHVRLSEDGRDFGMFWSRPLSPSASLHYSSQDGRYSAND